VRVSKKFDAKIHSLFRLPRNTGVQSSSNGTLENCDYLSSPIMTYRTNIVNSFFS
jgi:hypothetical protein